MCVLKWKMGVNGVDARSGQIYSTKEHFNTSLQRFVQIGYYLFLSMCFSGKIYRPGTPKTIDMPNKLGGLKSGHFTMLVIYLYII